MSYRAEVIADSSGQWCWNNLRFETYDEAKTYAADLMSRWFAVRETRVVQVDDEVNVRWHNGRAHHLFVEGNQP